MSQGTRNPGVVQDQNLEHQIAELKQANKELHRRLAAREQALLPVRLQASETRYRELFDNMSDAVAVYEAVDDGEDFVFRDFNRAGERAEKVKRQDIVGRRVTEMFPGVKDFGLLEVFQRVWRTGEPEHHPIAHYKDDRITGWRENYVYKLPSGELVAIYEDVTERKIAEETLRMSEARLRALFEAAPDCIFIKDCELKYVQVNEATARLFVRPASELIGRTDDELFGPEAAAHIREVDNRVLAGETIEEEHAKAVDGKDICFHVIKVPMRDHGGEVTGLCGIARDITERERAAEALARSEATLRSLFLAAPVGIGLVTNRVFEWTNSQFQQMVGYSDDELHGQNARLVYPDDEEYARVGQEKYDQMKREGIGSVETRFRRKDGSIIDVWLSSAALDPVDLAKGAVFTALDITERKRAEAERARLAMAIEQASESIIITDTEGVIQYVNPAFESTTGYGRDVVLGQTPGFIMSGRQPDDFYEDLWERINRGQVWRGRFINRKKDGSLYLEEGTISPVRNTKGRTTHFVGVMRDVTTEVELEERLQQANKMEALGTLTGGIAHDFNNILYAVLGHARLVMDDVSAGSEARYNLEQILKGGERASELVRKMLTFSRQSELELVPLELPPLVDEGLRLLKGSLPSAVTVRRDIAADCRPVLGDRLQLHQLLLTLCTNAHQALAETGGLLEIELANVMVAPELADTHPDLQAGPYVRLSVRDTGVGMDQTTQERMFEPFFTTKKVGEGSGLGLSTVHGIVKHHHGAILVQSKQGEGSVFEVYLPVAPVRMKDESGPAPESDPVPHGSGAKPHILLVDDEEVLTRLGETVLQRAGYDVLPFTSSVEALATFAADPYCFALVITDYAMPDLTGLDLAERLLAIRPDLPIILATGFSSRPDVRRAESLGIRELVQKPLEIDQLAATVRRVLEGTDFSAEPET